MYLRCHLPYVRAIEGKLLSGENLLGFALEYLEESILIETTKLLVLGCQFMCQRLQLLHHSAHSLITHGGMLG
jgi:hypothetical protein